jgi:hypothetical protein
MVLTLTDKLLARAFRQLDRAASAKARNTIYALSHLAAMHAAGAFVSSRITPEQAGRMSRPDNLWTLLPRVAPELADWSDYFAAGSRKRNRAEHGEEDAVTTDEAEEMLASAHKFLDEIEGMLAG